MRQKNKIFHLAKNMIKILCLTFFIVKSFNISEAASHTFPSLPLEDIQQHQENVEAEIKKRWQDVITVKGNFSLYKQKNDEEIYQEFKNLQSLRLKIWYRDPDVSPHICNKDYKAAQSLLGKGYYRTVNNLAFAYNHTDDFYNASTILINGQHFIALQEPNPEILSNFFTLLINQRANILIRLNPKTEYTDSHSIQYWDNRLSSDSSILKMDTASWGHDTKPIYIPYFTIETWQDDQANDIESFYNLVQNVRNKYKTLDGKGPIACHCASGVGRTGTFIAGMVLAELMDRSDTDQLSIEKVVLQLSIQRPNMVGTASQYLMLYRFVDYYSKKKNIKLKR